LFIQTQYCPFWRWIFIPTFNQSTILKICQSTTTITTIKWIVTNSNILLLIFQISNKQNETIQSNKKMKLILILCLNIQFCLFVHNMLTMNNNHNNKLNDNILEFQNKFHSNKIVVHNNKLNSFDLFVFYQCWQFFQLCLCSTSIKQHKQTQQQREEEYEKDWWHSSNIVFLYFSFSTQSNQTMNNSNPQILCVFNQTKHSFSCFSFVFCRLDIAKNLILEDEVVTHVTLCHLTISFLHLTGFFCFLSTNNTKNNFVQFEVIRIQSCWCLQWIETWE
jgi:hypothetical protein